jgi:glycosyltransferase involved in cell wall biosynthesis
VSVGRLERYKGHHRAIAALPQLMLTRPGVRLRIVGTGPYEGELRRSAQQLGVGDRVEIEGMGYAERTAMARLLARAGAVVLLSDYESQGLTAMEALALGRPVVVTDATALHELVESGRARGIPIRASTAEVAATILEALDTPSSTAMPLATWDECARNLLALYRLTTEGAHPGP